MRDITTTNKFLDISLEYDAIFGEPFAAMTVEINTESVSISYTKVTPIHYSAISKKDTTWKINVKNVYFHS